MRSLLAGVMPDQPTALREVDMLGMTPGMSAMLRAATQTDSLLPLLDLLEPKASEEPSKVDQILDLLQQVASSQLRQEKALAVIGQRLAVLEQRTGGSPMPSVRPSHPPEAPASPR
ncbi:hypothetical protein EAH89_29760 [Roseomonas nepalensis]|uniref:Uncharacterized protein n=1 Tax=Muricoccus nepalensis TaxID=1854500 RepID=A0A502EN61_9PROT|nr:hypothetical protein EAH89_29760 [Roseomonas nepalensis]